MKVSDVNTVNEHAASLRVVEAKEKFYKGRFAEAVAAVDMGYLAFAGRKGEVGEDVVLHVGVAEGDVAELDFSDFIGERFRGVRREDGGLEGEEFEEVGDEKAVIVESGNGGDERGEVSLSAAEGLEEHDEGAEGDGSEVGLGDEEENDSEHGYGLDDAAEDIEHPQSARDGEEPPYELPSCVDKTGAEEVREAE